MAETGAHLTNKRFARAQAQAAELGTPLVELSLGAAEELTILSGVITVTRSYARLTSETSTADQLDSIVKANVTDGDLLLLVPVAGHTITVDDAVINLGAVTRAVAPGGSILLRYDSGEAQWTEVTFLAAADNV